jgi:hypothetical protein
MGLIDEKNRESKISWHCPFKSSIFILGYSHKPFEDLCHLCSSNMVIKEEKKFIFIAMLDCTLVTLLKGTLAQDFRPLLFFLKLSNWYTGYSLFENGFEFTKEIDYEIADP